MTFDEFISAHKRKNADELVTAYLEDVFGIAPFYVGSAKNYFIRFEHFEQLTENFDKIRNTSDFAVQKGDLCVWGSGMCDGNGYASIAMGKGSRKHFYTYERRRHGKRMKRVRHNYKYFLGVLRAKDQSKVKGK